MRLHAAGAIAPFVSRGAPDGRGPARAREPRDAWHLGQDRRPLVSRGVTRDVSQRPGARLIGPRSRRAPAHRRSRRHRRSVDSFAHRHGIGHTRRPYGRPADLPSPPRSRRPRPAPVRTLERVNKACNGARTRTSDRRSTARPIRRRWSRRRWSGSSSRHALDGRTDRVVAQPDPQKFGDLPVAGAAALGGEVARLDRVTLPTANGKRTVRVYVEPGRGSLRPPLEGKPTAFVFRNGDFESWSAPRRRRPSRPSGAALGPRLTGDRRR